MITPTSHQLKSSHRKKSLLKYLFLSIFLGKGGSNDFIKNVFHTFFTFSVGEINLQTEFR